MVRASCALQAQLPAAGRTIAEVDVLIEFVPSIGVLVLFVILMRVFLRADRSEREAEREFLAEQRDQPVESPTPASSEAETAASPNGRQDASNRP